MSRVRRKKNPSWAGDEGILEFAFFAAVAYGVYWLWQQTQAALSPGTAAGAAISSVANAFVNLTSGPGAQATGTATLPNGQTVPLSSVTMTNMSTNQASYGGQTYTLSEDTNGNFVLN